MAALVHHRLRFPYDLSHKEVPLKNYPLNTLVERRVKIVKMMLLQNGADTSEIGSTEMEALDTLITSVVSILTLYESFEKSQNALVED